MLFNLIISFALLFGGNSFQKRIDNYLKTHLAEFENYEFKIKSDTKKNGSLDNIKINKDKDVKIHGKYCYIPVIISKGNRTFSSLVTLELKLYDKVLVARRDLRRGENLSRSDFNLITKEISNFRSNLVNKTIPVEFFRVRRAIKNGEVLTANKIEGIPAIKKGDKIIANLVNGNILITLDAVAKQDGLIGEKIRITADRKIYKAEVIDKFNVKKKKKKNGT